MMVVIIVLKIGDIVNEKGENSNWMIISQKKQVDEPKKVF